MRLVILEDYDKASEWAAKYVRNTILKFNPEPGKFFVLGLPTGLNNATAVEVVASYILQVALLWGCTGS